ncbi:MAG TPA: glycoside hydrolase family 16 protein [Myxococcaceae bacterium]|nr:glycoside hydrolase family 16 protein [Myxococcaceae bacterium]
MRLPHVLALLLGAGSCTAPERKPTGECPPIHAGLAQGKDPKPVRAGRFDHAPVATCTGNLLQEEFQDLRAWSPRSTAARELYENASFEPPAVSVSGGKLAITASFGKGDGTGCLDEHGGQVTYAAREFAASDGALYEAIMKPSGEKGVVSAFFAHRIDGSTKRPTTCQNNHEIDVEVIRMADGELRVYFTTWIHSRSVWSPCGPSVCEQGFNDAYWDDRQQESNFAVLSDRFASEFHAYGFRWTPQAVEFLIDGELLATHRVVVPSGPMPLKVNTWFAQAWACRGKCPCTVAASGTAEVERICVSRG